MKAKSKFAAIPYLVWMLIFIIVPLGMVVFFGFTTKGGEFTFDNFTGIAKYAHVFWKSIYLSVIATVICLILAFPLGFLMSRMSEVGQRTMLMLIMLPMWMSFLLRTYGWMTLLENEGLINKFLGLFGIGPFEMINTKGAVVLGMVYNYLPFMILPIYSVIVKLDHSLIEAARDLGANSVQVFRRVILPLSLPGVLSGITMVFVPSVSTFAISKMLGGGTEMLLGDLIEQQYMGGAYNPYLGAAISLVMMVIVVICMVVMNRFGEGEEQAVMM